MNIPSDEAPEAEVIKEARHWQENGWTAQVIKNDDDEGWAVAMTKIGASEPALIGPGPWAATRRTPSRWTPTPSIPW